MKIKLKPVGQELAQHRHLLVKIGLDVTRRRGNNIEEVGIGPSRPARDGPRRETISSRNQLLQGKALRVESIDALHPDEPAARIGRGWLDRRDLERVERGSRGRGLREYPSSCKS